MKRPLVLWGASGQAKVLAEFVDELGYEVIAVFDNDAGRSSPLSGVPVYHGPRGFAAWQRSTRRRRMYFLVAVGGDRGEDRLALHAFLLDRGLTPATVCHPRAYVARDARLGPGSQVLAHATVGAAASVGTSCIVNTAASVDHDTVLGDGVHIGPGATVCGEVRVGRSAFVGAGAIVLPRLRIGERAVVGAGAVVVRDVAARQLVVGRPARARAAPRKAKR